MAERDRPTVISDGDVETIVAAFNGNARAALRAVMHDLSVLVRHHNATSSRGFARQQHELTLGWSGEAVRRPGIG